MQLAYNYESWEVFEAFIQPIINHIKPLSGEDRHLIELKSLEVLQAFFPLNVNKSRKKVTMGMEEKDSSELINTKHSSGTSIYQQRISIFFLLFSNCLTS